MNRQEKIKFSSTGRKSNSPLSLSRKQFIRTVAIGGVLAQLPVLKISAAQISTPLKILTDQQLDILEGVQEILFPRDGNGPGAKEINALKYLGWVISDKEKDPDEIKYIIDGIGWVDETAQEDFSKDFLKLSTIEQEELIAKISRESWGESWLSVILTFIFEALLCDPQYGGNPVSIGWNWLTHNPGQPRPTKDLLYPEILKTMLEG